MSGEFFIHVMILSQLYLTKHKRHLKRRKKRIQCMEFIEGDLGRDLKSLFLTRLKHYRQILLISFCLFSNIALKCKMNIIVSCAAYIASM